MAVLAHLCFYKFIYLYLFLAALGLRWGVRASHCSGFFCAEHGSRHTGFSRCGSWALERRLSSCGAQAELLRGMWELPRPEIEPVSPALAGGFLTTAPPGKFH